MNELKRKNITINLKKKLIFTRDVHFIVTINN